MPNEYTRQRQGRDFSMHETLMRALAASRIDSENTRRNDESKTSLLKKLERFKQEAERNAVPIDGDEPQEKRGLQK
jgi:hypothetical protein